MEGLEIRASRVKIIDRDKLKAFADIVINESFVVKGFRVIEGQNGLFVSMPSKARGDNQYDDIFFPITAEARQHLQKVILDEYERVRNSSGGGDSAEDLPF